jgi:hypothetical protein
VESPRSSHVAARLLMAADERLPELRVDEELVAA